MARKKSQSPEPAPERPEIGHWRDWLPSPDPEPEVLEQDTDEAEEEDTESEEHTKKRSRKQTVAVVLASLTLLAGGGGGLAVFLNSQDQGTEAVSAAPESVTVTATPTTTAPPPFCSQAKATSEDGTLESPEGAIQHLQYSYYVTRDAEAARDSYTEDARVSEEGLSSAIESTPEDTTHCLEIEAVDEEAGLYNVDLQIEDPDGSVRIYLQKVTVAAQENGEYRIATVEERKEHTE